MLQLLWSMALVALLGTVECQVVFPTDAPKVDDRTSGKTCNATNGSPGICYEFRSDEFKNCNRYYPSIDSSNPNVASQLNNNLCKNTGSEAYFCCPTDQRPDIIPGEDICGKPVRDNVVGGEKTDAGDWPWLAAIGIKTPKRFSPFCGGTLITKQHVLTAAHCFGHGRFNNTIVRLGEFNVQIDGDGALDFDIVDERIAGWDSVTKVNDVMLLKLDRPVATFTDAILPACLPYHLRNEHFDGKTLQVVGWGIYNNNVANTAPIPLLGNVEVVPISNCAEQYKDRNNNLGDKQMCAGTGGTDSCRGDSGGPLNTIDKFRFYVVGIVSFGPTPCGSVSLPGVYARVGAYLDWIEKNIFELL